MAVPSDIRKLAVSITAYSTASIVGPLIIFGGAGYYLSKYLNGGKTFLFVGVGIAFIVTSVLQFFKIRALLKKMSGESMPRKN